MNRGPSASPIWISPPSAHCSLLMQTSSAPADVHAERMSCPARLQEPEEQKKEKTLSRFFHTLAHKLKLSTSPEDDRDSLLRRLGFGLDFVAVVQEPPQERLFEDAADCLQRLGRVKDVFVRSKEEVKGVGTVVQIEVTLKPRKEAQAQGIFHPGKSSTKRYVLTRPFEECRKLLKVIQYCASRKQHESFPNESEQDNHSQGKIATPCAYCADVELYAKRCWTQPPLMATAVLSQLAVFRKIVLTNSLNYFIHLARSQYPAAGTPTSDASTVDSNDTPSAATSENRPTTNTNEDHPDTHQQQQQSPATTPYCQAQAELAILLHDFLQLQTHVYFNTWEQHESQDVGQQILVLVFGLFENAAMPVILVTTTFVPIHIH